MIFSCRKLQHGNYAAATKGYDFSLLQLYNGFNLPNLPNVKTACLPTRGVPRNVNNVGGSGHVLYEV